MTSLPRETWAATQLVLRRVRTEERLLIALWILCFLIALSSGTGFDLFMPLRNYWEFFAPKILGLFVATRVLFYVGARWAPRGRLGARVKRFLYGDEEKRASVEAVDLEVVRGTLLLFVSLAIYTNIKVRIPFINEARGDQFFEDLDTLMFGSSFIPWIEGWFRGDRGVVEFFEGIYMHGYFWMMLLVLLLYVRRDLFALRWTFISVCFVYLIAIVTTAAYPSYGPCFLEPERFAFLKGSAIEMTQKNLGRWHDLQVNRVNAGHEVVSPAFSGIAAFPSLHVGHMVIMLMIALRTAPLYAAWMGVLTLLTFIATIGFGWHYAVDAVGGILLAVGLTHLAHVCLRKWDARREARVAPPSIA